MCRVIRRTICLSIVLWMAFICVSLWSGGEKIRSIGDKTGGIIKTGINKLGDKADKIKEKKDNAVRRVKEWSGSDKDDEEDDVPPPNKKGSDAGRGKSSERRKGVGDEGGFLREMWDSILEKVKEWKKE